MCMCVGMYVVSSCFILVAGDVAPSWSQVHFSSSWSLWSFERETCWLFILLPFKPFDVANSACRISRVLVYTKQCIKNQHCWGNVWLCIRQHRIFLGWGQLLTSSKGRFLVYKCNISEHSSYVTVFFTFSCADRTRLARVKSVLNLSIVRRYQDRAGNTRIQGGPHLKQSGIYPIQLGLKAGFGIKAIPSPCGLSRDMSWEGYGLVCNTMVNHLSIESWFAFHSNHVFGYIWITFDTCRSVRFWVNTWILVAHMLPNGDCLNQCLHHLIRSQHPSLTHPIWMG